MIQLQLVNPEAHLDEIQKFFQNTRMKDVISPIELAAKTGLTKERALLLLSLLSLSPDPVVSPVTIPFALGKAWPTLKEPGIIDDADEFEIPSEIHQEGFVPSGEIKLLIGYEVCNEPA